MMGKEIMKKNTFIVAEISANHGHNIEIAKQSILLAKNAGADAVKIQTYTPDTITIPCDKEPFRLEHGTIWDGMNLYELYQQAYTPYEWHKALFQVPGFEMSEEQVQVQENGDQSLTVSNLTNEDIPAVRIFYKFYMEEEETYVGGITYTAKLTDLKAGESRKITPSHYVSGYSRVMMVRTYDTAE